MTDGVPEWMVCVCIAVAYLGGGATVNLLWAFRTRRDAKRRCRHARLSKRYGGHCLNCGKVMT